MGKFPIYLFCLFLFPSFALAETLNIEKAIQSTLSQYSQLKALQANRQAAEFDLKYQKTGYLPQINLEVQASGNYLDDEARRTMHDSRYFASTELGLVFTQNLWNGKNTKYQVESAQYALEYMDNRVLDTASNLALETIIAYIDLLRCQKIVDLSVENVAQHKKILSSQEQRKNIGAATIADVTQIQGRLARAESTLIDAQTNEMQARERLARLTALPLSAFAELKSAEMPFTLPTTDTALELALANNFMLQTYISDYETAESNTKLTRSAYQPTVDFEIAPTYYNNSKKGENWEAGGVARLVFRWNLYQGGGTKAQVQVSEALALQKKEEMLAYKNIMEQEIANTQYRYSSALEQIATYTQAVKYNTQTRNAFLQQFQIGERSLLDVLDTESELYNSSVQLSTMESNKIIAAYRLLALSGQLLSTFNIDTTQILAY